MRSFPSVLVTGYIVTDGIANAVLRRSFSMLPKLRRAGI